ncbi:MAG TPA: ABC transporter ATP-binding protein [Candidatus Krumholzibacteria bacterium]|nr:ABC transporter ATP-binding protein [Candidatus Krumholzibacteria bacterium]HPD70366.1 ABC transporter ATP-binding protein [Candidatus Krumholzibacteria bacterium]HRY39934.1 ABC transporter ATP-binding protein [Candidatus Krumholzibacteria bacterium]
MIRIDDLHKSYGATAAVRGLSLAVGPGRICGLIGPDGAGKTTTMRIVCGLLAPDRGTATVLGRDCTREARAIKSRLGYMPQRFSLYPDLTVAENLRFFADLFAVGRQERARREAELMEFSKLGPFRERRAGRLSGGMKQKLALSCTLIHTPEVLVLDEPTTGVDPVSRREFWRILRDLANRGLALLVSTPYLDEADLCDDIVLMHGGRAIARGTPAEVAAGFPRRLLEVRGPGLSAAIALLRETPVAGTDARRYGDRLHVVYTDQDQAAAVRARLAGLAVEVSPVGPGIEDAFVALLEGAS